MNGLWSRPLPPWLQGMRPNSVVQMTIVSSSRPRLFRSLSRAAAGWSMLVPMSPWSRAISSCESQLRRGKPLSAPLQTCTKRTPRSSSRRAIRQLRPKSSVIGSSRP